MLDRYFWCLSGGDSSPETCIRGMYAFLVAINLFAWAGTIGAVNDNLDLPGSIIIGISALSWMLSVIVYRLEGSDKIDVDLSAV